MNPEEITNVFDAPIEDMTTEFLEESTDQFTAFLITHIMGRQALEELDAKGEARFTAVVICDRFIKMMYERSVRVADRQTQVDWLNSLL